MFKAIRASATPEVMLKISRAIFSGPVTRLVLTTPTPNPGGDGALLAALARPATIPDDRLPAVAADLTQLPKLGAPGTIVSQTTLTGLSASRRESPHGAPQLASNNTIQPSNA